MIFVDNLLEHRWKILAGRQLRNSVDEKEWKFLQKKTLSQLSKRFDFWRIWVKSFVSLSFSLDYFFRLK